MTECIFCEIVAKRVPATYVYSLDGVIGVVPLNRVTPGHVIFIPHTHVEDFTVLPWVSGKVIQAAADYWRLAGGNGPVNLITSKGREATQSVFHLHVHLVPRKDNDGLHLPWTKTRPRVSEKTKIKAAKIAVEASKSTGIPVSEEVRRLAQ